MKRKTFKAVAYEYSHDTFADVFCQGEGVSFSDSVAKAIAVAKDRALRSLSEEEAEEKVAGTPILATVQVYKNGKEIINETY
jgi:hypothetical protein